MNRQRILQTACLVAATLLAAACTQDDLTDAGGTALPEGKYPMTFSTAVEGLTVTRANTAEGQWTTSDEIAVQVGSEVKKYKPTGAGASVTLQAAPGVTPFYWQKSDEKKNVSAWCCGMGTYNASLPTTWTVQTNQSTDGYQQSDFLYAMPQELTYSNGGNSQLTFKHLPAKVVINLKAGGGITNTEVKNATVRLVNQAITSGTIDAAAGTVAQVSLDYGNTITPQQLNATDGYQQSVQALVVPQQMQDKRFIEVAIDGVKFEYYYTPTGQNDANLVSGQQYTYNITVKNGYLNVVTVSKEGGAWSGGDTEDVSSSTAP